MLASASCVAKTMSSTVSAANPTAVAHADIRPRTSGSLAGKVGAAMRSISGVGPRAASDIDHSRRTRHLMAAFCRLPVVADGRGLPGAGSAQPVAHERFDAEI